MAIDICSIEEIEKAESILFNWLKNDLKPFKFPEYLSDMKLRFPDRELHHIFGSYTSMKGIDLVIPLTKREHDIAEKDKSGTTVIKYLPKALNLFFEWVYERNQLTKAQ